MRQVRCPSYSCQLLTVRFFSSPNCEEECEPCEPSAARRDWDGEEKRERDWTLFSSTWLVRFIFQLRTIKYLVWLFCRLLKVLFCPLKVVADQLKLEQQREAELDMLYRYKMHFSMTLFYDIKKTQLVQHLLEKFLFN